MEGCAQVVWFNEESQNHHTSSSRGACATGVGDSVVRCCSLLTSLNNQLQAGRGQAPT